MQVCKEAQTIQGVRQVDEENKNQATSTSRLNRKGIKHERSSMHFAWRSASPDRKNSQHGSMLQVPNTDLIKRDRVVSKFHSLPAVVVIFIIIIFHPVATSAIPHAAKRGFPPGQ